MKASRVCVLVVAVVGCIANALHASPVEKSLNDAREIAWLYLEQHSAELGLDDPRSQLVETRIHQSPQTNVITLRMQELYRGVEVWGGQLLIHVAQAGTVTITNALQHPGGVESVSPKVTSKQALALAKGAVQLQAPTHHSESLTVYRAEDSREWFLAWEVILESDAAKSAPRRWKCIVDATRGRILATDNLVQQ